MSDVVVITGVGKRLGFELAKSLLRDSYQVVGTYRTPYSSIDELRDLGAALYQLDFYEQSQVDAFIGQLNEAYSSIKAVIHNASDWAPDPKDVEDEPSKAAETLARMMNIHVSVPYQLNLALQSQLKAHGKSDIIHISDYVAEKGSKKHIAYAASKAAMHNLTLSFAALLAPEVKVNTISPALLKFNVHDGEEYKQKALSKSLMRREAGFEEMIEGVRLLLNSQYMTGRNLHYDGGRHLK